VTATIIRLRQRSDPAFRAMAEHLIAVYFRDGQEAFLVAHYRALDKGGPEFSRRLAAEFRALLDEAGSPR
jgi:hypothetical protein